MTSKELKNSARKSLKHNYFRIVILCFLVGLFASGNYIYQTNIPARFAPKQIKTVFEKGHVMKNNSDIIFEFVKGVKQKTNTKPHKPVATRGVLALFANQISTSGSFLFGILNALNQFLFQNRIEAGIIILIGAFFSFLYWFFIGKVLPVGEVRFFLENRKYKDTQIEKVFFPYQIRKTWKIASTIFLKNLYTFLWSFTIVGGFIKHYSYLMVPYILAENPMISRKDAFMLSRQMMDGYKWKAFCLDLSFLGWHLLGALTWNLGNVFLTNPYKKATFAEFYMQLRQKAKQRNLPNVNYLCDVYLEGSLEKGVYPKKHYLIKERETRRWLNIDYHKEYSILHLVLLFFTFSIIGWGWEVLLHLFSDGEFVNRGTMYGPWLPIYGWGGVLLLVLLKRIREKPWLTFLLAMLICGIIEYGTAWYLETFKQMKWWDYSGYFLNLHGRICLEGLLVFGLGGCVFIYIIAPLLDNLYDSIAKPVRIIAVVLLVCCYLIDFVYSSKHPNQGPGITDYSNCRETTQIVV